jgi:iron only hydrogenase large subunit-like protein
MRLFFDILQKVEQESTPKVAKITLNDCLACSGCITSAESILIDQQDYREAQRVLKSNQLLDQNVYFFAFSI